MFGEVILDGSLLARLTGDLFGLRSDVLRRRYEHILTEVSPDTRHSVFDAELQRLQTESVGHRLSDLVGSVAARYCGGLILQRCLLTIVQLAGRPPEHQHR